MNLTSILARCAPAVMLLALAAPERASAAILTYAFSGTHTWTGTPPATDLLLGYDSGDPFSGTLTFDTSTPGSGSNPGDSGATIQYPGAVVQITVLFDNTHALHWTAPGAGDGIFSANGFMQGIFGFRKEGPSEQAFTTDSGVFAVRLGVDFLTTQPSLLPMVADFDPLSPVFDAVSLMVDIHGPSLYEPDGGADRSVFFVDLIDELTLVPEPTSAALLGLGLAAIGAAGLRRRRRGG